MNERSSFRKFSQASLRRLVAGSLLVAALAVPASAMEPVAAVLEQKEVWAGEPVLIVVTLYSPGPFSGTASFDLPELPSTAILRSGRPLVGSETIDGETWLTQRHELRVVTQQTGDITIPAFLIRFEGKPDYTSPPEPIQGQTPTLGFRSRRPPGVPSNEPVLAATQLRVRQTWTPDGEDLQLQAGDVLQRDVLLEAAGTTAMMIPPIVSAAPEHVRVYESDPVVQDATARGQSDSTRRDFLRYQFEQPGTYQLPAVEIVWWDYQQEELMTETLEGRSVTVTGEFTATVESPEEEDDMFSSRTAVTVLLVVIVAGLLIRPARRVLDELQRYWNAPEAAAGRRVLAACRAGDPAAAYDAVVTWNRLTQSSAVASSNSAADRDSVNRDYQRECHVLAARLYSGGYDASEWNGDALKNAFAAKRKQHHHLRQQAQTDSDLPPLNPPARAGI